jgi:hypothetical protein
VNQSRICATILKIKDRLVLPDPSHLYLTPPITNNALPSFPVFSSAGGAGKLERILTSLSPSGLPCTHKSIRSSLTLLKKEGTEPNPLKVPRFKGDLGGSNPDLQLSQRCVYTVAPVGEEGEEVRTGCRLGDVRF